MCRHTGTVPNCRQKRNVPKCRLSPTLEVTADGVDHALGRGLAEHIGRDIRVHKDIHKCLQGLDLAARLGDAQIDDDLRRHRSAHAGFTTAI